MDQRLPLAQLRNSHSGMIPDSEGTETSPKTGCLMSTSVKVLPVPGCHLSGQAQRRGRWRKAHGPNSRSFTPGPHSYSHIRPCPQKMPCLAYPPACYLKSSNHFFFLKRTTFSFTLGPTNYVAGSAPRKLQLASHTPSLATQMRKLRPMTGSIWARAGVRQQAVYRGKYHLH